VISIDQIISAIEARIMPPKYLDALHAGLRRKGDIAYKLLSSMNLHTNEPFDPETKSITVSLLNAHDDPMLAGRALRVLTVSWGYFPEFRHEITKAVTGADWDASEDYKLAGLVSAGFYLAHTIDKDMLTAVVDRLRDSTELTGTRQAARDALLRAMGKTSKEIVEMSVPIDSRYSAEADPPVMWALEKLAGDRAG
jgi:hypothetical protein